MLLDYEPLLAEPLPEHFCTPQLTERGTFIVWRIENDAHLGPYTGGAGDCIEGGGTANSRRPAPWCERGFDAWLKLPRREMERWRFAFATREQALCWFSENELERLARRGYTLRQVEAERVIAGVRQVVFLAVNP